jgi:poly(ADP-ribose) glycohydrolase ARH3
LESKFLGSLVGTAVGDGLGASLEGRRNIAPGEIQALAEGREAVIYTDDTHMMIGVAESLIETRGFDGEHMARTFIQNHQREPWRGYGPGPPRVFRLIKGGEAWDKAAEKLYPGGSFGNGSAMRIAPIGLLYHNAPARIKEVAHISSQITHVHPWAKEGAALQAYAVALAAGLDPASAFDRHGFLDELQRFVEHEVYKQKLEKIADLWDEADRDKVALVLGSGIEALDSVPTAICSFLSHPGSFEEAVLYAIGLGGDTDTIGAMTGAISGAYLGIQSIPERWKDKLENRGYIEDLAKQLWLVKALG